MDGKIMILKIFWAWRNMMITCWLAVCCSVLFRELSIMLFVLYQLSIHHRALPSCSCPPPYGTNWRHDNSPRFSPAQREKCSSLWIKLDILWELRGLEIVDKLWHCDTAGIISHGWSGRRHTGEMDAKKLVDAWKIDWKITQFCDW